MRKKNTSGIQKENVQRMLLQLEATKRQVEVESQGELCRQQVVTVEAETIQTNIGTAEEEMNDVEDSVGEIKGHLSEESQANVE